MAELDKKIADKKKERRGIIDNKKTIRDGGSFTGANHTMRDELNQRQNEVNKIREVKHELGRQLKTFQTEVDKLEAEKANLLKTMHPKYHSVDQVNAGVKELEYEMTTRTLNAAQESKMIKEISKLKQSQPQAARF